MIYRVLAPGGVYICITHGIPSERLHFFQGDPDAADGWPKRFDWSIDKEKVQKPTISQSSAANENDERNFHWIYIMKKTSPNSGVNAAASNH